MARSGMAIRRRRPSRIGAAIKAARLRAGMRQEDVHAASGVATSSLSKIETGEARTPGYRTLRAIAAAIGSSPAALAGLRSTSPTRSITRDDDEEYLLAAYRRLARGDRLIVLGIAHRMLHAPDGVVASFVLRGRQRCRWRGGAGRGNGNPAHGTSTGRGRRV